MKKQVTITAKTIDEAIAKAVEELGAPDASDIEYTVIEEPKKGLFGIGATPAVIEATYQKNGVALALEFLTRLTKDMGLNVTMTVRDGSNGDKVIAIDGDHAGVLIGHHGDTLDALQYLSNLAANKKSEGEKREYVKITIDVENYRAKREETLRALARRMAHRVLRYKKSVMLEPMNPYERRIIHSEIQTIDGVSTNSIGSEDNRKVVIFLDEKSAAAHRTPAEEEAAEILRDFGEELY
ncbi:MAG: protein jag [Ruminococcaceae bacterium]|nr:protein jag [Oscillospiraceae bacterium]